MNTIQKGNVVELGVQYFLVKKGLHVFTPITDGCGIDLVFLKNGCLKSVQIKSSQKTATGFKVDFRKATSSSRLRKKFYSKKEIDFFATIFEDKLYMIPYEDVHGRHSIVFRFNSNYRNQNEPLMAIDYLW